MLIEKLKYIEKDKFLKLRNVGRVLLNHLIDFLEFKNIEIIY
jgi:hypothetical protein